MRIVRNARAVKDSGTEVAQNGLTAEINEAYVKTLGKGQQIPSVGNYLELKQQQAVARDNKKRMEVIAITKQMQALNVTEDLIATPEAFLSETQQLRQEIIDHFLTLAEHGDWREEYLATLTALDDVTASVQRMMVR